MARHRSLHVRPRRRSAPSLKAQEYRGGHPEGPRAGSPRGIVTGSAAAWGQAAAPAQPADARTPCQRERKFEPAVFKLSAGALNRAPFYLHIYM